LRVPKWRVRWRLLGRSFGWRWTLGIENRAYFRRAIRAGLRPLPADVPLWVQAHPKNETHHGLIERLLARGRADDNEAVIRNRLEVYREKTAPLIRFYSDKGLLVSVPAQGTVEEITKRIESVLG